MQFSLTEFASRSLMCVMVKMEHFHCVNFRLACPQNFVCLCSVELIKYIHVCVYIVFFIFSDCLSCSKLTGMAFRVPTPNVSVVDLTVRLEKPVSVH